MLTYTSKCHFHVQHRCPQSYSREANTTSRRENMRCMYTLIWACMCLCICVLWGIRGADMVSFHLYSFSLRATNSIQPFISLLLCDCAVQYCAIRKATDSWQALTTFWAGLGCFYFQFKHFESALEVTSATREEFKLKLKSPQPKVRCYTWHSLSRDWCMLVFFSGQPGEPGGMTSEVLDLLKFFSASHMWCCQQVFCINVRSIMY